MKNNVDVVVVGGGPSGLICAATASKNGKSVLLIDKNKLLARKLRITGKGRCNLTNSADISEFIPMVCSNPNFMYSAFYTFTNDDLMRLFEGLGVKLKEERGGRIFPESDSAKDVADALVRYARECDVVFCQDTVTEICVKDNQISGVKTLQNGTINCNQVVIACGGMSYPLTGSNGDGYKLASALGHKVVEPKGALVPLCSDDWFLADLQGLSLKNISVKVLKGDKKIYDDFGEMLFAHFGLTGPVILSASSNINFDKDKDVSVFIDFKPALTEEQLDRRVLRDFNKYINKNFSNSLGDLLPQKLIPVIIKLSGIDPYTKVNVISKEQRKTLCTLIKNFEVKISGTRPIDEAIITRGGVDVKEINPSTMESKLQKGLYFAGEVIDVDAYTGGYNLQIAFSTGYLAGINLQQV